jgi:3-oxoadipate enol-lactonase
MSERFRGSSGLMFSYYCDDFTDPWEKPEVLLLLHAAMGSSKRWYAAVPPLCRHYRVMRMDLRGHGDSEVPSPDLPLDMPSLVQDVRDLLDHIGANVVHVVGNSAGGYIAQNLAMESPERVRSLMLFGSTPGLKNSQAHTWLPRVARDGLRNFLAATIEDRFPPGHDPGHIEWFLDEAAKNDTAYIGRFVGLMTTLWWPDELPRIKCPTLLVMPGAETVGSTQNYDVMRLKIPDCELIAYEGLPHNICDIVPDRCAADILAFLRRRFP